MFYYSNSDINPTITSSRELFEINQENDSENEGEIDVDINEKIISSSDYKKYLYTDVILNLYAKGYNVIRINGGFSALAFSFN